MRKKTNLLSRKISIIINLLIVTALILLGLVFYYMYRNFTIKSNAEECLRIGTSLASLIDTKEYARTVELGSKTEYWYELKDYMDFLIVDSNATYMYIVEDSFIRDVRYFVEAKNKSSQSHDFMTRETTSVFTEELFDTLNFGNPNYTEAYDAGNGYGWLVSGFAPILAEDGTIIGVIGVDRSLDLILKPVRSLGILMLVIAFTFTAVFIFISYRMIANAISRPIGKMCDAAKLISLGNVDVKFDVKTGDEFEELAEHLNRVQNMTANLYRNVAMLENQHKSGEVELKSDTTMLRGDFLQISDMIRSISEKNANEVFELLAVIVRICEGDFSYQQELLPGQSKLYYETIDCIRERLKSITNSYSRQLDDVINHVETDSEEFDGLQGGWKLVSDKIKDAGRSGIIDAISEEPEK